MVARVRFSPIVANLWRTRYEDGESLGEIVESLAEEGLYTSEHSVRKAILEVGGKLRPKGGGSKSVKGIMLS